MFAVKEFGTRRRVRRLLIYASRRQRFQTRPFCWKSSLS